MKQKKRFTQVVMICMMLITLILSTTAYAQNDVIKSERILNKPETYRAKGVTYVQATQIFKLLGNVISWNQQAKQLSVDKGKLIFTLGNSQIKTSQGDFNMAGVPISREGRVYIPLNALADVLGYTVSYKEGTIKIRGTEKIGQKGSYEEEVVEKRITISAAGDFTLGYYKGQGKGGRFDEVASANGYSYFMKGVKSIFEKDDLTIVNLEGPLTNRGVAAEKEFAIRGLPEYTQILTSGNIEAVNLANNHTYDYQKVGYEDTVSSLKKSNIGYFGEDNTYYATKNDIRVAVIGAKGWSNATSVKENLKKCIGEARTKADLIIVEFHWGIEREHYPNSVQQDLAKYAIDQGAHLILGSHPHVIQGIGSYKGANIVYSMGNFCFGANKNPADKDTFIYQETFILTDDGIQSESSEVIPCSISSVSNKNDYQPTILSGEAKERVLNRLTTYSRNLKS